MEKITLADAAYSAFLFRSDLHYLHHHITGPNFLELHEMLGEYYDKALEDFDYFSEQAIAGGEKLINVNNIHSTRIYKLWDPVTEKDENIKEDGLVDELRRIGNDYLETLDLLREYLDEKGNMDDIISEVDSIKNFWRVEIQYKNEQRGK